MGKNIFSALTIAGLCFGWQEKVESTFSFVFLRQRRRILLYFFLLSFVVTFTNMKCTEEEETYIEELKAFPGDGKVLIQWEITGLDPYDVFGIKIARSNNKHNWTYMDQDTVTYFNNSLGRYTDTQVQSGEKYYYKVRPGFTEGFAGDYSEIVEVTPESGLSDPSPPVANLQANNLGDSIEISWDVYPTELYFIASTIDTTEPLKEWYLPLTPDTISNCKFRIKNQKDDRVEYYVIVPFPDSILGEASQKLLVKHE